MNVQQLKDYLKTGESIFLCRTILLPEDLIRLVVEYMHSFTSKYTFEYSPVNLNNFACLECMRRCDCSWKPLCSQMENFTLDQLIHSFKKDFLPLEECQHCVSEASLWRSLYPFTTHPGYQSYCRVYEEWAVRVEHRGDKSNPPDFLDFVPYSVIILESCKSTNDMIKLLNAYFREDNFQFRLSVDEWTPLFD